MGRLLVLVALLGVMLALRSLRVEVSAAAHDPLTLAAIGFVIMASYTAAEVGSEFKLPRVSGYIAAGVLLGPSVFDVLSSRVVEEMTMFNTLALGLIATGAGLELELKSLGRLWRTLSVTVLGKIVLAGGFVFGAFYAVETTLDTLGLSSTGQVISIGLILGTVAVGTSPAIVLAVINETGAKGRVADLALGAAVIKDFVLVLLLAVAVAVSTSLLGSSGGGHGHDSVALTVAKELLGSIAVGALVGLIIILYVRFVASEMLLFVAALVLAAAEISRILHLDLLLVFIASGFVVRNFSRVWHEVLEALETVSLPVFVVFFTIAGARIDLGVTYKMLPLALLLVVVRAMGFFGATRLGGWVGGDTAQTSNRAFMAYIPQAGVTLGLLGLAAQALPAVAEPLMAVGVACVAINLMVGPVTLRRSLQAAAEESEEGEPPSQPNGGDESPVGLVEPGRTTPAPIQELEFGDPALRSEAEQLDRDLRRLIDEVIETYMRSHEHTLTLQLAEVLKEQDGQLVLSRLHAWARSEHSRELSQRAAQAAQEFYERSERRLAMLSAEYVVPCPPELLQAEAGDGFVVRFRKLRVRIAAVVRRRYRERHVPLRLAGRRALSPRMSMVAVQIMAAMCRTQGRVLTELRRRAAGDLSNEQLAEVVTAHLQALCRDFRSDAENALAHGLWELADITRDVDSPVRPLHTLRFSAVEPEVRRQVELISTAPEEWERALGAVEEGLELATAIARVGEGAEQALSREVLEPLADAAEELAPAVAAARSQLRMILTVLQEGEVSDDVLAAHAKDLSRLREQRERDTANTRRAFRAAAALHSASVELRQLVDSLPTQMRVPGDRDQIYDLADPSDFPVRVVSLRNEARRMLILELMPTVDVEGSRAAVAVQDLDMRRAETVEMVESALDGVLTADLGRPELTETIERALEHLAQGEKDTHGQLVAAHDKVAAQLTKALAELSNLTARGVREALAFAAAPIAPLNQVRVWLRNTGHRVDNVFRRVREARARLLGAQFTRHLTAELRSIHDLAPLLKPRHEALPVVYGRLFRLEPLRDLRLSAARETELDALLGAEQAWLAGGPSSVLLYGDPGAGCTTLLNLSQADFNTPRLIRPEPLVAPRDLGLIRALAYELRRKPTRKDVVAGLTSDKTVVVLDDLGCWCPAGAAAVPAVREFLDLMLRTHKDVFWVVTARRQWLALLNDVVSVPSVFGRTIELAPLDVAGIRRVIETRHNLSGMPLVHNEGPLSRLIGRIREGSSADLAFRLLHSVCAGNLQASLSAWGRAVEVRDSSVHVHVHRLLLEQLPSLAGVEAPIIALLVHLVRYGPVDMRRTADSMGLGRQETQRYLRLLDNSGLLVRYGRQMVSLDPQHRWRLMPRLPLDAEWRGPR